MRTCAAGRLAALALRAAGGTAVALFFFLEGGCTSGQPAGASSDAAASAAQLESYERARAAAWDSSRRFKALFRAEVSPKVGVIGRGWLSVWWDGAGRTLEWRTSAPIAGGGRGGVLRVKEGEGGGGTGEGGLPLSARLSADDLIACILGTPEAPHRASSSLEETPKGIRLRLDGSNRSALLNREGKPIELTFPRGEVVRLEPGAGVPRRIEARGPDGRAVLTLESYGPWAPGEEVPPL